MKLVVIWSQTGATARIFSKGRFPVPIVALSSDHVRCENGPSFRRNSQRNGPAANIHDLVHNVDALVQERKFAALGDRIVIVAGAALGTPGTLNGVILHTIGEQWTGELENSATNGQTIGVQ